jgi:micrococcal nuclease
MRIILLSVLLLMGCSPPESETIRVASVHDGDTFTSTAGEKFRLSGIDCPEIGQEYGFEAHYFTDRAIRGKDVRVARYGRDTYGRTIADVWYNGHRINQILVELGLAWVSPTYGPPDLYKLMLSAKQHKLGLWGGMDPEPPYLFRKRYRTRNTSSFLEKYSLASSLGVCWINTSPDSR